MEHPYIEEKNFESKKIVKEKITSSC